MGNVLTAECLIIDRHMKDARHALNAVNTIWALRCVIIG